jgi:hypothetical protein
MHHLARRPLMAHTGTLMMRHDNAAPNAPTEGGRLSIAQAALELESM